MKNDEKNTLGKREIYTSWTEASIRYRDLDPNGHVNNGAINTFFEDGRVQFRSERLIKLGGDILSGFVIARFSADYLKALSYPGRVDIGTAVKEIGKTSYLLAQGIFDSESCVAIAEVVTVCINRDTKKPEPISSELVSILNNAMLNI